MNNVARKGTVGLIAVWLLVSVMLPAVSDNVRASFKPMNMRVDRPMNNPRAKGFQTSEILENFESLTGLVPVLVKVMMKEKFHMKIKLFAAIATLLIFSGMPAPTRAQAIVAPPPLRLPVEDLVNEDGTLMLNRGVTGNLDLKGWQVRLDPQRGPILKQSRGTQSNARAELQPAQPLANDTWNALANGVNGTVFDIAIKETKVYVGGHFLEVCGNAACDSGNVRVNNIAQWDGKQWSGLGNGVDSYVETIALKDDDVYIGGLFLETCGNQTCDSNNTTVNYLAHWNGTGWERVGYGVTGYVFALAFVGDVLYAGGEFREVCGDAACDPNNWMPVYYVAAWDGNGWARLGYGLYAPVTIRVLALAASGTDLYVGGAFTNACLNVNCTKRSTSRLNNIAKWNGSWVPLGNGFQNFVTDIQVSGSDVYAVGYFREICGNPSCNSSNLPTNYIAHWNGSGWTGVGNGVNQSVFGIAINGSDLFIGGEFTSVCGNAACDNGNTTVNHVAKWNGSAWSALGNGVGTISYAYVRAFAISGSDLYIGGYYRFVCGNLACDSDNIRMNSVARFGPPPACPTAPPKPTLFLPENKTKTLKTRLTLQWNFATCADTYTVTVKDAATGKNAAKATGLTVLHYKTKALPKGKTYKWFVQACNTHGCTKSAVWKFTVN